MSFRLFYILLIFAAVKCGEGIWAQEEGLASYYHHRFHGRKSSSGRVHDKEELESVSDEIIKMKNGKIEV